MPDDEPLDDLQAVGLTAAASAARVTEVVARNAQEQRERQERSEAQRVEDATVRQAVLRDQDDKPNRKPEVAYDSPERRSITEQMMERQGVPAEAREARVKSDLMNGQDPKLAASQGAALKTQQRRSVAQPERVRGR